MAGKTGRKWQTLPPFSARVRCVSVPPDDAKLPKIDLEFESLTPEVAVAAAPQKSLKANTLIVMAGTLGSRLSGVVRQILINRFGDTLTDAFTVATNVPNLLRELLAEGALVNAFIPVYKSLDTEQRKALASAFSGLMIAVNLVIMGLGILAAPLVVDIFLAGHSNVDRGTAIYMTRLVMPFLMLISLSSIAMGLLNADEHFKESSFAPVAFNIASIVALLLLPQSATWLALGWLVGGVAQLVVQLPALSKFGLLPTPALMRHPALGRVLAQMAPFTLTAGARQFLNVYVKTLLSNAAQFPQGTVAGYSNAETLFTMANGLFVMSPALALFPRFAEHAGQKRWPEFRQLTAQAIRTSTFLAAPMSALLVALSPYAISLLVVDRLNFSPTRFAAGSGILSGWALALIPWAIVTILLRTFYARERTREAVMVSASGFVLEVLFYRFLVPRLGFWGFGVSTTLSGIYMAAVLLALYHRQLSFPLWEVATHLAKVLPLALLAGAVAWAITRLSFFPPAGQILLGAAGLALAGGAGLATYLAGAVALKMPEVGGILRRLR